MLNKDSDFNFFVPIDDENIVKAKPKDGDGKYDDLIIQGVASDNSEDTDNEMIEPGGIILDRFLTMGFLNYDHMAKSDPSYLIGEPISAKVVNGKLIVKGKLYGHNPLARSVYNTIKMLKKSGSTRKLGWSIEGKSLERSPMNPKRITKALLTGIAITPNPKNANSYADIVKGNYSQPLVEEYKFTEANGGKTEYLIDITNKETGIRYTIDKNLNLKVEKAISTTTAQPIIREDLERKLKILPFGAVKKALVNVAKAKNKGKIPKTLFEEIEKNKDIYKKYM